MREVLMLFVKPKLGAPDIYRYMCVDVLHSCDAVLLHVHLLQMMLEGMCST